MRKVLKRVPLSRGNIIAWMLVALTVGFIIGWISAVESMRYYYFPVV